MKYVYDGEVKFSFVRELELLDERLPNKPLRFLTKGTFLDINESLFYIHHAADKAVLELIRR